MQLLGEIGGDRLPDLYRAADLLVLPTRGDNLPVAVLEAAASGLPAVGTRVGGVPEEVLDGKSGLLVSPGDEAALAAEMAALLSDPSLRTSFGRAAREHAVTRFSRSASARDHERLYRSLV
ncbi:MAG: hypothetical protein CMJ83_21310 [Planctomycetes bacterium]|nr:hypothetical protein [Planctomycetota bacterium]